MPRLFYFKLFLFFVFTSAYANQSLTTVDDKIKSLIKNKTFSAASYLVIKDKNILGQKIFGKKSFNSNELITEYTLFDLASITKIYTALGILKLIDEEKIKLTDKLSQFFIEFKTSPKNQITIEMLLRHTSGLKSGVNLEGITDSKTQWDKILSAPLVKNPNEAFVYSDVNYLILAKIIEIKTENFEKYILEKILNPLSLKNTFWANQLNEKSDFVSTNSNLPLVHDPTARQLNSPAGHAGIFSNALDLSLLVDEIINCKEVILSLKLCQQMKQGELRGLGVDLNSPYMDSIRGNLFTGGLGHSGYTGVSFYANPDLRLQIILFTNRVHGGDTEQSKKQISELRKLFANTVYNMITPSSLDVSP